MTVKFFVTGTDTGVGKTTVSVGLLKLFNQLGYSTIGLKPIASGGIKNEDAMLLNQASSVKLPYEITNPFAFEKPVAPHIAAKREGKEIVLPEVIEKTNEAFNHIADVYLVEGVGGWCVPLNDQETMVDFVKHYKLPVILVIGIRLGCISHALLTEQAIKNANLSCVGWIANCIEQETLERDEVILTLKNRLSAPCLGVVSFGEMVNLSVTQLVPHPNPCMLEPLHKAT